MPSSSKNLAQYFANAKIVQPKDCLDPANFPTTSQAIDAHDDEHFETTSFKLKRTRSMGLLDEFIAPTRALLEEQQASKLAQEQAQYSQASSLDSLMGADEDDENQFIENIDDLPKVPANLRDNRNIIYDYNDENEVDDQSTTNENEKNGNMTQTSGGNSLSSPETPDLHQPHDDNDITYEPSSHVDYLSHKWKESDISKSWRYIVLRRKDVANSARLENASWRTWAQAKYHLKTISPESVNWLKDSDVTWLYGPLYAEPQHDAMHRSSDDLAFKYHTEASTKACLKLAGATEQENTGPKPILKKRTVGEMLAQPSIIKLPPQQQSSYISPPVYEDDFNEISKKVNAQYNNRLINQDLNSIKSQSASPLISPAATSNFNQPLSALSSPPLMAQNNTLNSINSASNSPAARNNLTPFNSAQPVVPVKRHIHFNDRVEQCISLSYPDSESEFEDAEYSDENGYNAENDNEGEDDGEDDESDDEGGFFLSVRSQSSSHLPTTFQVATPLESKDDQTKEHHSLSNITILKGKPVLVKTIEMLPATTLNYGSDREEEQYIAPQSTLSHNTNTLRGYNYYHYDYNSVFTAENNHIPAGCNVVDDLHRQHQDDQGFEIIQDVDDILVDGDSSGDAVMDIPEGIVLGSSNGSTTGGSAIYESMDASSSPEDMGIALPQHIQQSLSNTKLFKSGSSQANLNQQIWGGNVLKGSKSNLLNESHQLYQPQPNPSKTSLLDQWEQSADTVKRSQSNLASFGNRTSQSNLSAQFKSISSSNFPQDLVTPVGQTGQKKASTSGFQFNQNSSDDDSSEDEGDEEPIPKPFSTTISHPHLASVNVVSASSPPFINSIGNHAGSPASPIMGGSIRRVTSGSSSASLSDFAAHGFISRGKDSDDITDLQQSFSHLNSTGGDSSTVGGAWNNSSENLGNGDGKTGLSFKNKLLNSWGKK